MFDWLSFITFFPLVGIIILMFIPKENRASIKAVALITTFIDFLFSLIILIRFKSIPNMQFEVKKVWIENLNLSYHIGVDGISLFLIILTTFLSPIVILSAYKVLEDKKFEDKNREYMISILFLQIFVLGALISLDMVLFYLFWEAMLIPIYFLIGIFGGEKKNYAAIKLFLYTIAGSILMIIGIFVLYFKSGANSFDISYIIENLNITKSEQIIFFIIFSVAFAVKIPMFPLHTWLPDAHVQAPTGGSVILAGILLKMGVYGYVRFAIPLFPNIAFSFAPAFAILAVIGIIYGALLAISQKDIKKLVAYSSISHLGYVVLGLFAFSVQSVTGSIYQMLNHGISTGALFLLVGVIYERRHTKEIKEFGGLSSIMPIYAVFFLIATLSSIALPLTNGFIGEFLILAGSYSSRLKNSEIFTILATSGVVLGAAYMLWMFRRVMFGPLNNPKNKNLKDLSVREFVYLLPLMIMIFIMGVFPNYFIKKIEPSVKYFIEHSIDKNINPNIVKNRRNND